MRSVDWIKGWVILCAGISLSGCAMTKDVQILDQEIYRLQSQLNTIQKEKDSLKNELTTFQKETKSDISTLQKQDNLLKTDLTKETKGLQADFLLRLETLQSQLNTIQKEKEGLRNELTAFQKETKTNISTLQKEDNLLKTDLTKETKGLQADFLLRLETLQSQLNTIQKEKEGLRNELTAFQKETKTNISTLQKEDSLLKTDLTKETKGLQADFLLRLETLQSEIRILSTGLEEYKEYVKRPAKEIDRVKEDIALRTRILEEKGKTLEEKYKAQEDRVRTWEERIKGAEDRLKGLDEKIGQVASKRVELEKLVPEVKGPSTAAGDLYKDAYETFQKGDLEGARRKFEAFLKQYPHTELSDNAQFWIGETYYLKKDFEKAILEYEKAIVKYPEGDKTPAALFKQALAFLELGDKTNARNLLRTGYRKISSIRPSRNSEEKTGRNEMIND